jgi:hypothetical protein
MPTPYIDPRGPLVQIVEVLPTVESPEPWLSGTVLPIRLACGHVNYMNPDFLYRVGSSLRCLKCRDALRRA